MSISYYVNQEGTAEIYVSEDSLDEFKQMVARATNTWERCSPEMKKFRADVSGMSKIISKMKPFNFDDI